MCLFHDLGEAITGDVPAFEKSNKDRLNEDFAIMQIINILGNGLRSELEDLFIEIREQESKESKLFKALDKIEALIQHNEAPIETWLPLEFELNKTYGTEEAQGVKFLEELREEVKKDTIDKIINTNKEIKDPINS